MKEKIKYNGEERRENILNFLRYRGRNGLPTPSIREIGEAVGLSSSSTVHRHLLQLRRENKVDFPMRISRGISIVRTSEEICTCCNGTGWASTSVSSQLLTRVYVTEGEFLNNDFELIEKYKHVLSGGQFNPKTQYTVRENLNGKVVFELEKQISERENK